MKAKNAVWCEAEGMVECLYQSRTFLTADYKRKISSGFLYYNTLCKMCQIKENTEFCIKILHKTQLIKNVFNI